MMLKEPKLIVDSFMLVFPEANSVLFSFIAPLR